MQTVIHRRLTEFEAVNHRVVIAGRLLFHGASQAIDSKLSAVIAACDELAASIKAIQSINSLIKDVGKFPTLGEKALDLLTLVP